MKDTFDTKSELLDQRYRIFFSRKSWWVNQSIKSQNFVFFFPRSGKKKYKGVFFFPRKSSWGIHSGCGGFFFIFFESGVCFFSPIFVCFFCVFFSCKSSHAIHSFDLEAVFFFSSLEKKYSFFIHSIDFASKCEKNELLQKKTKYDTFATVQNQKNTTPTHKRDKHKK